MRLAAAIQRISKSGNPLHLSPQKVFYGKADTTKIY